MINKLVGLDVNEKAQWVNNQIKRTNEVHDNNELGNRFDDIAGRGMAPCEISQDRNPKIRVTGNGREL